ncbi:MAG: ABC transporter ATP-binding protein [Spirochaetes bacterium]|nr:ABC transporter ATP-binding protein [Spirochaetota bacterium]
MRILEGENVCKYFGGLKAVSGVDFHVDHGEILGLIGPNGAGKTTLFNIISASLANETGNIHFDGKKITGKKAHHICRSGIARTFQAVKIFGAMTALENVQVALLFGCGTKISKKQASEQAMEWLEFVGLLKDSSTLAKDLTIANQKRLEVARALATNPKILMLDEVIAGLNATETTELMALVRKIRDKGITIIMIEHVMKAIMSICDRIIVLHHGEKIAEGTPEAIASNPTVIEIYLGK